MGRHGASCDARVALDREVRTLESRSSQASVAGSKELSNAVIWAGGSFSDRQMMSKL